MSSAGAFVAYKLSVLWPAAECQWTDVQLHACSASANPTECDLGSEWLRHCQLELHDLLRAVSICMVDPGPAGRPQRRRQL